jgi:hypothetical protein
MFHWRSFDPGHDEGFHGRDWNTIQPDDDIVNVNGGIASVREEILSATNRTAP